MLSSSSSPNLPGELSESTQAQLPPSAAREKLSALYWAPYMTNSLCNFLYFTPSSHFQTSQFGAIRSSASCLVDRYSVQIYAHRSIKIWWQLGKDTCGVGSRSRFGKIWAWKQGRRRRVAGPVVYRMSHWTHIDRGRRLRSNWRGWYSFNYILWDNLIKHSARTFPRFNSFQPIESLTETPRKPQKIHKISWSECGFITQLGKTQAFFTWPSTPGQWLVPCVECQICTSLKVMNINNWENKRGAENFQAASRAVN